MNTRSRNTFFALAVGALVLIVMLVVVVKISRRDSDGKRGGKTSTTDSRLRNPINRINGNNDDPNNTTGAGKTSGDIKAGGKKSAPPKRMPEPTPATESTPAPGSELSDVDSRTSEAMALMPPAAGSIVIFGTTFNGSKPMSGLAVRARLKGSDALIQERSDSKGVYRLPPAGPGDYTVTAESENGSIEKLVTLVPDTPLVQINFDFSDEDSIKKIPVMGIVVKKQDGKPIPEATVELADGGAVFGTTTTAEDGTFEILSVKQGVFTITARAGFFLPAQAQVVIREGVAEPAESRLELNSTGALRIQVLTPQGQPVPNALVSLFGNATFNDPLETFGSWQTGPDGTREIQISTPTSVATFRIGAYKEGFIPGWSQDLSTSGAFGESVFKIVLGTGVAVKGRIVDEDKKPIDSASITVKDGFTKTGVVFQRVNAPFPMAVSGADGLFELSPVEAGTVTLGFGAEGYVSDVRTFGATTSPFEAGDIMLESTNQNDQERVFGVVVDQAGMPMVSHSVYMKNANGAEQFYARTDSRGGFKIDKVPPSDYVIYTNGSALRDGIYITMDQVYPYAKPGESGGLYIVYDMAQSLKFSVVTAGDEPVRNFRAGINIRYKGSTGFGGTQEEFGLAYERSFAGQNGDSQLDHLIAGTANLTVQAEGYGAKRVDDINLSVGGVTDIGQIILESGSSVKGIVIGSENRVPLPGVMVRAAAPPGSPASHPLNALSLRTITDGGGNFTLPNVPKGSASLIFTRSGRGKVEIGLSFSEGEEVDAGTIKLPLGARLRGTVTAPDGSFIPDILIVVNQQNVYTDRDGRYFYDTLPAGEATVLAEDRTGKFARQQLKVTLAGANEIVADFTLVPTQSPATPISPQAP